MRERMRPPRAFLEVLLGVWAVLLAVAGTAATTAHGGPVSVHAAGDAVARQVAAPPADAADRASAAVPAEGAARLVAPRPEQPRPEVRRDVLAPVAALTDQPGPHPAPPALTGVAAPPPVADPRGRDGVRPRRERAPPHAPYDPRHTRAPPSTRHS